MRTDKKKPYVWRERDKGEGATEFFADYDSAKKKKKGAHITILVEDSEKFMELWRGILAIRNVMQLLCTPEATKGMNNELNLGSCALVQLIDGIGVPSVGDLK